MLADQIKHDFVLPSEEESKFIQTLRGTDSNRRFHLLEVLSSIDMERATAFDQADEDGIKAFVRTMPGGFQEVNRQVIFALRHWYAATAEEHVRKGGEDSEPTQAHGLLDGFLNLLLDLGEYHRAKQLASERLAELESAWEGSPGPQRGADKKAVGLAVSVLRQRLAQALEKLGECDEALSLYQRAIADRIEILGDQDTSVADAYNNIGNIHLSRGRHAEALRWYERDLAIRIPELGEDHVTVAYTRVNMGNVYRGLGRLEDALSVWRGALEAEVRHLGPNHVEVAGVWKNIGVALRGLGRPEEAAEAYQRALAIETTQLGPRHPNVARTLMNLGVLRLGAGDFAEALRLYEEARGIQEGHLGPDALDVAYLKENSGAALLRLGEPERAAALFKVARLECPSLCAAGDSV